MEKHVTSHNDYKVSITVFFAVSSPRKHAVSTPEEQNKGNYADNLTVVPTEALGFNAAIPIADNNIRSLRVTNTFKKIVIFLLNPYLYKDDFKGSLSPPLLS
jgi:hypothetical protein